MLTTSDLNTIQGITKYLSDNVDPDDKGMDADVTLTDSNGSTLGRIHYDGDVGDYVFSIV